MNRTSLHRFLPLAIVAVTATACGATVTAGDAAAPSATATSSEQSADQSADDEQPTAAPAEAQSTSDDAALALGDAQVIGEGFTLQPTRDGSLLHVVAVDESDAPLGCEGQPQPVLFVLDPSTGEMARAIDVPASEHPGVAVLSGPDDRVLLRTGCEEHTGTLHVGVEQADGSIVDIVEVGPVEGLITTGVFRWLDDETVEVAGLFLTDDGTEEAATRVHVLGESGWADAGRALTRDELQEQVDASWARVTRSADGRFRAEPAGGPSDWSGTMRIVDEMTGAEVLVEQVSTEVAFLTDGRIAYGVKGSLDIVVRTLS